MLDVNMIIANNIQAELKKENKKQVDLAEGIDVYKRQAWQVIAPMARQLSLGELVQPTGTWLNDDTIGVFACPDGIRPVIFLLEAE